MFRRVLISVWDKSGVVDFARELAEMGLELISTGGTARTLSQAGLRVRSVEEITGFPEILSGRVKTLHPVIYGGILARRTREHQEELIAHNIVPIDMVVVNLYPFQATVSRPDVTLEEALEQIDIGGVALLRAAAKNFETVAVVCDPNDYELVLQELRLSGDLSMEMRRHLALKAFRNTAHYDAAINRYLAGLFGLEEAFPHELRLNAYKFSDLRYGENPHQAAALYNLEGVEGPLGGRLLAGKPLSYNNLLDLDAAWCAACDFSAPTAAVIKHTSPCGLASAESLPEALSQAIAGDPVSAFGGVLAVNRPFDEFCLQPLEKLFVEAVAAPSFTAEAQSALARRKDCRLLKMGEIRGSPWQVRSVRGGLLLQERDEIAEDESTWRTVTKREPGKEEMKSLSFAWKAVKHVKSNAIVLAQGTALVGVGAGQMSRVDATELAIKKAGPERCRGAALASDAFFPFPDSIEAAARAGISAIIQPGGSVRDEEVIAAADRYNLAMLFTGVRHFRH